MVDVRSVTKPRSPFESMAEAAPVGTAVTKGYAGTATDEVSRSFAHLVVKGKSFQESVIGLDERVRILDTDLAPWRMICALRMRGGNGAGAIGTGWFVGPRTVLTAGHCVFSGDFFGGWATSIEVIPGLNGTGGDARPFGSVTSTDFSSIERWTSSEDPDFDIGCIHLEEPLGDKTGWFGVGTLPGEALAFYGVNVAGYPADRGAGNELYHASNRIIQVSERRLFYETDTFGGQSGGPAWIHETDDGPPIAVGVHAYGTGGTPAAMAITANSAPRIIPEVLDIVIGWVEKDGGWPAG